MKWLRRLLRRDPIDHEAVARKYHSHLTIAQKPLGLLDENADLEGLARWHRGYAAWYDACVAPLMKEK